MSDKLKPCPFCGSEELNPWFNPSIDETQIVCADCVCMGPAAIDAEEAARLWNERAGDDSGMVFSDDGLTVTVRTRRVLTTTWKLSTPYTTRYERGIDR